MISDRNMQIVEGGFWGERERGLLPVLLDSSFFPVIQHFTQNLFSRKDLAAKDREVLDQT